MESFSVEQILTVAVLCVWFAFPMGILISFMRQDKEQRYPKINMAPKRRPETLYTHPVTTLNSPDDTDEDEDDDIIVPNIPAHQIPKRRPESSHWRI